MGSEQFTVDAYRQHVADQKLIASKCTDCGALYLPPRPICPVCQTQNMTWAELQGDGTVAGVTSIAIVPAAMAAKGFGRDNPYVTAIVNLKEGPSVTARIEMGGTSDAAHVGMAVRADFLEEAGGDDKVVTLVFRPT